MEECLELAGYLGSRIAENQICLRYKILSRKINSEPDKKKKIDDFENCVARINKLIKEEKAVPEELQKEYEEIASMVNSDNDLLLFIEAQKSYLALIQSLIERIIPNQV
ncbi:MAG TPA: YlbF family regulator [Spirochaetota bacterium]|nr:YlbF family regulator [Spirochaetota bacterium]